MQIVYEVFEKGAYANVALERTLRSSSLAGMNRSLVTEIVNGSIRMVRHLDWVLDLFLAKPISKQQPWVRNILRVSLYQLIFMDRIPAYACVNDAVSMAVSIAGQRLGSVVNGVLRNYLRRQGEVQIPADDMLQHLAIKYSYPDWLVQEFVELGDVILAEEMLGYMNQPPALVARNNLMRISRDDLVKRLQGEGVDSEAGLYTPWSVRFKGLKQALTELTSYKEGLFYLQNEGSMLAAAILDPPLQGMVYDLGAGVGGKSTHLAEIMGNQGQIVAVELHAHKLRLLEENCRRLGIGNVLPLQSDLLQLAAECRPAERVLLDAPCSGWGVLNRRSDARWRQSRQEIAALPQLQYEMLQAAAELVKPGGLLLYSTCTINRRENEQVVTRFLDQAPFSMQGFADKIGFFPLAAADYEQAARGWLSLLPGRYDCDGMFYALLRRQAVI